MRGILLLRLGSSLLAASLAVPAAFAQDAPPNPRLTFGFLTGIEVGRNLGLDIPEEGNAYLSDTFLSLGYVSETRTQSFIFDLSGVLRLGEDDGESISEFDDLRGRLFYQRESADSLLSLNGRVFGSRIEFLRLGDFIDPDTGLVELPDDFDDLDGTGTRLSYTFDGLLELGRQRQWGLTLTARGNWLRYRDVTDPGLTDTDRTTVGARGRLNLTPVLTSFVGYSRDLYKDDLRPGDIFSVREQTTDTVDVAFAYEISPRLLVDLDLGYSRIVTRRGIGRTTEEGFVGGLGFGLEMPDGVLSGSIFQEQTDDGGRTTAVIGRTLDRPLGGLGGTIGVTRSPNGDTNPIGSLDWRRETPRGVLAARLNREVTRTDPNENDQLQTVAGVSYLHEINPVSSITFRFDAGVTDSTDQDDRTDRTEFRIIYSRQITPDWSLNSSIRYSTRKESGQSRSTSPAIFIGLGRDFVFGL